MWGDPERAASFDSSDPLATLLIQISSPAHIPWGDPRWQEVLHGYDVWVHIDDNNQLMEQACQSMAKHAEMSSNLAALSLHVTRMLRELVRDIRISHDEKMTSTTTQTLHGKLSASNGIATNADAAEEALVADFSKRISRVAKARAIAGAVQLLRLLCHPVIVHTSKDPQRAWNDLKEAFTYHTRGDLSLDQPSAFPLMHSILDLIAAVGTDQSVLNTPEVYDTLVLAFGLLFVLCGTQLYQPFQSSFESRMPYHYILEELFREGDCNETIDENNNLRSFWTSSRSSISIGNRSRIRNGSDRNKRSGKRRTWTPKAIMETCLEWQVHRPPAPERSISHYYYILSQAAVSAKGGESLGPDGMYESYMVIQATTPNLEGTEDRNDLPSGSSTGLSTTGNGINNYGESTNRSREKHHNIIVDATRGVLTLSGNIILLPFRLVKLVLGVFVANKKGSFHTNKANMLKQFTTINTSRTRDVLWLSDSILTDLGCSLILLLANNKRNPVYSNPYRDQLKELTDNRWDQDDSGMGLPDLPNFSLVGDVPGSISNVRNDSFRVEELHREEGNDPKCPFATSPLSFNFERFFDSFGKTLHTEIGAFFLYTLLQASPSFAESLAVRSDLDTLILPLLRTLYFSSKSNTYMAKDYATKRPSVTTTTSQHSTSDITLDIRGCPFRSQSQLYVIVILLLLFSQDSSFGRDAFKRITVQNVMWYKERALKNINLGSILVLTLLRSLLFNLNRLHDVFLLSNCCAVLMNLSPSVVGLHDYAAMRLASVAVTVMKKHEKLASASDPSPLSPKASEQMNEEEEEDMSSPLAMHAEVAHTLLGIIKHSLSSQNLEGNLHLIYALVYHQVDLIKLCKNKKLYSMKETERIQSVTLKASSLIQGESARTAPKALKVLETRMEDLIEASLDADNKTSKSSSKRKKNTGDEEFTFSYEEETDPEIFFVPYVWEVIVCVVTASTMDWKKDDIRVFALLEDVENQNVVEGLDIAVTNGTGQYTKDAEELV